MTVSAALIVRDEEETLGRCLASIGGAVDEIVVVDTGSRDATKTIARHHGAAVFDFPWCDDFAAARQFSFGCATGTWVFWLDADDVVVGAGNIRRLVAEAPPEVAGFYWRYVLGRTATHRPRFSYWRERCTRHDGAARWQGRVHEVLVSDRMQNFVKTDDVLVEHHPREGRAPKSDRNLRILERECASGTPEPRLLYYLGREYADHGDTCLAVQTFQQYTVVSRWDDERYLAQVQIGDLLRGQGGYADARDAYFAAIKIHPAWPDAFFGLAATCYFLREWRHVVDWSEIGRTRPYPDTLAFINMLNVEFSWIIYYTNALFRLGRLEEALDWTRRALVIVPDDPWHLQNEQFFSGRLAVRPVASPGPGAAEGDSGPT